MVWEGNFVSGLKLEIRAELRLHRPIGLEEMIIVAQLIADRNLAIKSGKTRAPSPRTTSYTRAQPSTFSVNWRRQGNDKRNDGNTYTKVHNL